MTKTKGVAEWADHSVNVSYGCQNGCKYCYACQMAVRFKHFKDLADWTNGHGINDRVVKKGWRKRKGRIMFPTSHDIYYENHFECELVLRKMLEAGNEVLLTTKPCLSSITQFCKIFTEYKDLLQFRFTITSLDDHILKEWEPNAPIFLERYQSLKLACEMGYKTSISIEPYLDVDPSELIELLEPYVNETIWIGVMNSRKLPKEGKELYKPYEAIYSKEHLEKILPRCYKKANGKLRLKDSIRNILNPPVKVKKKITSRKIKWKELPI